MGLIGATNAVLSGAGRPEREDPSGSAALGEAAPARGLRATRTIEKSPPRTVRPHA